MDTALDDKGELRQDVVNHVRAHAQDAKRSGWPVSSNPWRGTRLESYWHDAWVETP
jgi:hypothetical protein